MISLKFMLMSILVVINQYSVESQVQNSRGSVVNNHRREEVYRLKRDANVRNVFTNDQAQQSCTTSQGKKSFQKILPAQGSRRLKRQVRMNNDSPRDANAYGTAIAFSGGAECLKYAGSQILPNHHFSVGMWVKPEGGQRVPVTLLGVFDSCLSSARNKGWSFGIKAYGTDGENEAAFFFRLHTDRSRSSTELSTYLPYTPLRWVHLLTTYAGEVLKMFIDGSQVAVSNGTQRGSLFSERFATSCKELILGGDDTTEKYFRGVVDDVKIWPRALSTNEVRTLLNGSATTPATSLHDEPFDDLDSWEMTRNHAPSIIHSDLRPNRHDVGISPPPCGITVCDDPDVIRSYAANDQLRQLKTVRYRIINVMLDNGTLPTVNASQVILQHEALNQAFGPYNITWVKEEINVRNSSLRHKTIILGCDASKIGNGRCDEECRHERTGNDGGDCDQQRLPCDANMIANGQCNFECNRVYHGWDGDDCCNGTVTDTTRNCFDPASNHRTYLSVEEYKQILRLRSDVRLNVYFASWTVKELIGLATFPWEKNVLGVLGGTVVQPNSFGHAGKTDSLVHELGHNLGLWHVHHGVSEMDCSDHCVETHASLELGDLCSDTRPTPQNEHCRDPEVSTHGECQTLGPFTQTPFNNFMSYASDACADHFTPQQTARMHCYLDLAYESWWLSPGPSPPPLSPRVVRSGDTSVELSWVKPLRLGMGNKTEVCRRCQEDGSILQYAFTASSPNPSKGPTHWAPHQATGAPDAEACMPSTYSWMPDAYVCDEPCYIVLGFKFPAIPKRITLWVSWNAANGINRIELMSKDGSSHILNDISAFCDMPYTREIHMEKLVTKIRIYINNPYVSIDAVALESEPHAQCQQCAPLTYRLNRNPPFTSGPFVETAELHYVDRQVSRGVNYTYSVIAVVGSNISAPSPSLTYPHGNAYCGDGVKQGSEMCDDGNVRDGDGCDVDCKVEEFFHCVGEPSICYHHDGDGICESFEVTYSISDCGFYTPEGFIDQWASDVTVEAQLQSNDCPTFAILGPPALHHCRVDEFDPMFAWHPCTLAHNEQPLSIDIFFRTPVMATSVLLYIATDAIFELEIDPASVTVVLIDTQNVTHHFEHNTFNVNCEKKPVEISVQTDLSKPIFYTRGVRLIFSSIHLGIYAAVLRSNKYLNPLPLSQCRRDQLYNPHTGLCTEYQCERPSCSPYIIKHGSAVCTGSMEGDSCVVSCSFGYELQSYTNQLVCAGGNWVGNNMRCVAVDCGMPSIQYARMDCPDGTDLGSRCKFECRPPARRIGSDQVITCEADGMWSLPNSYCQVKCSLPPIVKHASATSASCSSGDADVGTRCRFRCNKGFHVEGSSTRRRMRHTCMETGDWKGSMCVRVKCSPPSPVYIGLYSCTDTYYSNSRCTLKCPGPNRVTSVIRCMPTGEWNGEFTACKFEPGECNQLPHSGPLEYNCRGTDIGSQCNVSCKEEHHDPVLRGISKRRMSQLRPQRPEPNDVIGTITCTGQLNWYPDPEDLECVQQCSASFVGDGYCDSTNNRAHCGWDAGDCCASTVSGGIVRPFPATCTDDCSCRDPEASENVRQNDYVDTMRSQYMRWYQEKSGHLHNYYHHSHRKTHKYISR